MGPVKVSFSKLSVQSLLHFTTGESLVVTGDCLLNLSASVIKLKSLSAVRKGYKSPRPTSSHAI